MRPPASEGNLSERSDGVTLGGGEGRKRNGGWTRVRTGDTRIFSPLLYQLSYPATTATDATGGLLCPKYPPHQALFRPIPAR